MEPNSEAENQQGQEQQRLSIVIFRGDPIDAPQYRHTALFIEHLDQEGTRTQHRVVEVVGSAGIFEREENVTSDPRKSPTFVGSVVVATISSTGSSDSRLRDVIWSTPINNSENSWNCQNWVGDALSLCIEDKLILSEESDRAIDGMVDFILQARDIA
ncbi:hypothetical protein O1611_g9077 [Lasiodiplodia mahajangana]|uniref:Uncharacterized protein n=1 Tax=Lasiodiplodia mahajangana TaxID=1108764 RepID=A0ACC2JAL7_9PEZI|nr:hypothetical protein O1611_g9077 [Lasiodiplodia mahajangana]